MEKYFLVNDNCSFYFAKQGIGKPVMPSACTEAGASHTWGGLMVVSAYYIFAYTQEYPPLIQHTP